MPERFGRGGEFSPLQSKPANLFVTPRHPLRYHYHNGYDAPVSD
jgi:hypothetical protein